ncbi:transposase, partial [Streptomyces sp. NPDC005727]|uniref:IS110 family transposase n=1 Tax=Streptomyces sp. NPDC005727 TaxID=3157053 RepID=UPI0033F0D666
MTAIWAGIDAWKTHHHCVVIDDAGRRLLSRRVANDESELFKHIRGQAGEVLSSGLLRGYPGLQAGVS